jgi:hypothetical protein
LSLSSVGKTQGFPWVSTQLRVSLGSIMLLDGLGLTFF